MRKSFLLSSWSLSFWRGRAPIESAAIGSILTALCLGFVLTACDDSSSASSDETGVSSSSVESPDLSVTLSGALAESNGSSDENMEKDKSSSSFKGSEPVEVSSSSAKETKNSSDSKSSNSVKTDDSSSSSKDKSSSSVNSSSSVKSSNSSSVKQSSSSVGSIDPDDVVTGTMTDSRDNKVYKTVTIGTQTWMAENLNYAYTDVFYKRDNYTSDSTSWCYDNDPANCAKYGRLYTWAAAMDSLGKWSKNGKKCGYIASCSPTYPVRGICPKGWHLPSKEEFGTLIMAVGDSSTNGTVLKSTDGWSNHGNGTDAFGFSALPAGVRSDGHYERRGSYAYFWSSNDTKGISNAAYRMYLYCGEDIARLIYVDKNHGASVRCVKDSD